MIIRYDGQLSSFSADAGRIPEHRKLLLENGAIVVRGFPYPIRRDRLFGGSELTVPVHPHIFKTSSLQIGTNEPIHDAVVLVAHGDRDLRDNTWRFGNGHEVIPTVLAYNNFARLRGLATIDAVLVCNGRDSQIYAEGTPQLLQEGVIFPLNGTIMMYINHQNGNVSIMVAPSINGKFADYQPLKQISP